MSLVATRNDLHVLDNFFSPRFHSSARFNSMESSFHFHSKLSQQLRIHTYTHTHIYYPDFHKIFFSLSAIMKQPKLHRGS